MNDRVFWSLSYGMYVVTTIDQAKSRPTGCIVNSVMQITAVPATVAVSISHDNYTNHCIAECGRFALSILPECVEPSLIGTFGFRSARDINKFEKVAYRMVDGLPVLDISCGYVVLDVVNRMETDTHTVFLGKAMDGDVLSADPVMTYAYYHKVIKGKAPKNAPTYLADASAPKAR